MKRMPYSLTAYDIFWRDGRLTRFLAPIITGLIMIGTTLFHLPAMLHAQTYDCTGIDLCDNLVCFEGFEDYPVGDFSWIHDEFGGFWTYDGFDLNNPQVCGDAMNKYLLIDADNWPANGPAVAIPLQSPIEPGCSIEIAFKGKRTSYTFETSGTVVFHGSENYPCGLDMNIACSSNQCGANYYEPVCLGNVSLAINNTGEQPAKCQIPASEFLNYSLSWTNTEDFSVHYLIITNWLPLAYLTNWVAIDDLVVTKDCGDDADFQWTTTSCHVDFLADLDNGGITHEWDFDGLGTSSSPDPGFTFPGSGTYEVSHRITHSCGTYVVIHEVTVSCDPDRMCECTDPVYNLGSDNSSIVYWSQTGLSNNLFGKCISFIGQELIIDVPALTLRACQLFMGPGSELIIESNRSVRSIATSYMGCDQLWRGIVVEEDARLQMNAGKVSDAVTGVDAMEGSYLGVRNIHFRNDGVGLTAEGLVYQLGTGVAGCTFESPGPFLPPFTGQTAIDRTNIGVQLTEVPAFSIGHSTSDFLGNEFLDVKTGIQSSASFADVGSNQFSDLQHDDMTGVNLIATSVMQIEENQFHTMMQGITSSQSDLQAGGNQFKDMTQGITCLYGVSQFIEIAQNDFHELNGAMLFGDLQATQQLDVMDNAMTEVHTGIIGYQLWDRGPFPLIRFEQNIMEDFTNGFWFYDSHNLLINENIFDQFNGYGLVGYGNTSNLIRANSLTGDANLMGTGISILIENSLENFLCCNEMDQTTIGLQMIGSCPMENGINRNQFYGHEAFALAYENATVTGPQFLTGNHWHQTAGVFDAVHGGGQMEADQSKYTVEDEPATVNPSTWFDEIGGTEQQCEVEESIEVCGSYERSLDRAMSDFDEDVAKGDAFAGEYEDFVNWMLDFSLYARLYAYPGLRSGVYQTFYNQHQLADIGRITDLEEDYLQAASIDYINSSNRQRLIEIGQEVDSLNTILSEVEDSLLQSSPEQAYKDELYEEADTRATSYRQQADQGTQDRKTALSLVADDMDLFSPTTDFGQTYREVMLIYLDLLISGSVSPVDSLALYGIAVSCPYEEGHAIYRARSIYQGITGTVQDWPEVDEVCMTENMQVTNTGEEERKADIEIWPNPAEDRLFTSVDGQSEMKYEIRDIHMRTVGLGQLSPEGLDISHLTPGVHILILTKGDSRSVYRFIKV